MSHSIKKYALVSNLFFVQHSCYDSLICVISQLLGLNLTLPVSSPSTRTFPFAWNLFLYCFSRVVFRRGGERLVAT